MSLTDDLKEAETRAKRKGGGFCSVCAVLEQTSDIYDTADIRKAVASTIGAQALADIFRKNGIPIGRQSIIRHRKDHQ